MKSSPPKTCILCASFRFFSGEYHYSDLTPGSSWSASCVLGKFNMLGEDVCQKEYTTNLLKAINCENFSLSKEARKILGANQ